MTLYDRPSPAPVGDEEKQAALAVALLFTLSPSDRALRGWSPDGQVWEELCTFGIIPEIAAIEGDAA